MRSYIDPVIDRASIEGPRNCQDSTHELPCQWLTRNILQTLESEAHVKLPAWNWHKFVMSLEEQEIKHSPSRGVSVRHLAHRYAIKAGECSRRGHQAANLKRLSKYRSLPFADHAHQVPILQRTRYFHVLSVATTATVTLTTTSSSSGFPTF